MTNYISIEELRKRTGIDFVSSDSVVELQKGKSYKTLEKETESRTHEHMRNYGIECFKRLDYNIYPEGKV